MTRWITPSRCNSGYCVEAVWISPCGGGDCVEAHAVNGQVHVRDGKLGDDSPELVFTLREWAATVAAIKDVRKPAGTSWLHVDGTKDWLKDGVCLNFTADEWGVFVEAVDDGEFDLDRLTEAAAR